MSIEICQAKLDDVKACVDALLEQVTLLQEGIDFNVDAGLGDCTFWFDAERRDILRQATILVYLADLNLACYPLSESAVLFIEP